MVCGCRYRGCLVDVDLSGVVRKWSYYNPNELAEKLLYSLSRLATSHIVHILSSMERLGEFADIRHHDWRETSLCSALVWYYPFGCIQEHIVSRPSRHNGHILFR